MENLARRPWPCSHYERKCWLRADCCNGEYVPCRICHNDDADHKLDRFKVTHVGCRACGRTDVPVGTNCSGCNVQFARYYCDVCHLFEDDEEKAGNVFHCNGCGICRRGKGEGIDSYHCDRCVCCVPIAARDTHPCSEGALQGECPVCREVMADSKERVVFMPCGHTIHDHCLHEYTATKYTCPVCSKSLTDMSSFYDTLDSLLADSEPDPPESVSWRSEVLCNDCSKRTIARWHSRYHKCGECGVYNTRVLAFFTNTDETWLRPE